MSRLREAIRAADRAYYGTYTNARIARELSEAEGDPRMMAPSRRKAAIRRNAERLRREMETAEGREGRREVINKMVARLKREGYSLADAEEIVRAAHGAEGMEEKAFGSEPRGTAPSWGDDADEDDADEDEDEDEEND